MEIRGKIEEFRPYIPLIQGLRNPGMRNRHWDMLSEEIKINVKPKANLTFARCLEMKLQDHIESIAKIAEIAGKEYSIENVRMPFNFFFLAAFLCVPICYIIAELLSSCSENFKIFIQYTSKKMCNPKTGSLCEKNVLKQIDLLQYIN